MSHDVEVTVAFIPRERFSMAAASLRSLIDGTTLPFHLTVVDCGIPASYRREMEAVLSDRPDVRWLGVDHFVVPQESKNLAAAGVETEYVCFVENDMILDNGCIDRLFATSVEDEADVVVPVLLEGKSRAFHFEPAVGCVEVEVVDGRQRLRIRRDFGELDTLSQPQRIEIAESHVTFYRTAALRKAGLFDARLRMNEFIDDSLTLREAGCSLFLEPRARATFMPPPPVEREERAFFDFRWEPVSSLETARMLLAKWRLDVLPNDLDEAGAAAFLRAREHQRTRLQWLTYVARTRWKWPLGRIKRRVLRLMPLRRTVPSGD